MKFRGNSEIEYFPEFKYFTGLNKKEIHCNDFLGCINLKELSIPNGITTLRYDCFSGLTSLETINIPDSLIRFEGANDFRECNLKKFEAYGRIEYLGGAAFRDNLNLVSCMIPNAIITKIEANLFDSCKALESFDIPNTVTEIGGAAFASCISLKHLSIPEKVNKIAYWVFNGCTSMEYFICLPVVPPVLTNPDSFNNTNNCPIYVPDSSVSAYKTAENWSKHASRIKPLSEFVE